MRYEVRAQVWIAVEADDREDAENEVQSTRNWVDWGFNSELEVKEKE